MSRIMLPRGVLISVRCSSITLRVSFMTGLRCSPDRARWPLFMVAAADSAIGAVAERFAVAAGV